MRGDQQQETRMGFNATRRYRDDKRRDIWLLVAAIAVVLVLVLWASGVVL